MVNEAARCVEERVVDSPEDADYGMILGTGFAPFRGGPLRFAEHFGIKRTVEELERLARTEKKFTPCEILKKHARDGTKFYEEREGRHVERSRTSRLRYRSIVPAGCLDVARND